MAATIVFAVGRRWNEDFTVSILVLRTNVAVAVGVLVDYLSATCLAV